MSPTCQSSYALFICWHEFFLECSQYKQMRIGSVPSRENQLQYFLRYELLSTTFGPVRTTDNRLQTTDNRQQTESDTYEPTVQIAQLGSKMVACIEIMYSYFPMRQLTFSVHCISNRKTESDSVGLLMYM